jgi:hypothetical protein
MSSLSDAADTIVDNDRHAGHPSQTILVALTYVRESDLNEAYRKIQEMKDKGAPPRWLIKRWARDAGLLNGRS